LRDELTKEAEELIEKAKEVSQKSQELMESKLACGCHPPCSYHAYMFDELSQMNDSFTADKALFEERTNEYNREYRGARERQSEYSQGITYQSPSSNNSRNNECPICDGKGYVVDHNPFGITDGSRPKEICHVCKGTGKSVVNGWGKCSSCNGEGYVTATRGVFDLLKNGGGNKKECPSCHGRGF